MYYSLKTRWALTIIVLLLINNTCIPATTSAIFGKNETIHKIQDINLKGPDGEQLFLGYKSTSHFFLAGIYLSDDGYVLGVEGKSNLYYPMPEGEKLVELQNTGMLPENLPDYQISIWEYLLGYSLWPILLVALLHTVIKSVSSKKKN